MIDKTPSPMENLVGSLEALLISLVCALALVAVAVVL
jgi:hypothetical protein